MQVDEFLREYHLEHLDAQQRAAVAATDGPVLLLAVPGSGKTTTLIARLGYLVIGKNIPPNSILTMTYTVAATDEMRTRFSDRFGAQYAKDMDIRTINSLCARIIRQYEYRGHKAFELVSDEGYITQVLTGIWLKVVKSYPAESDIKDLRTKITYIKNMMLTGKALDSIEIRSSDGKVPVKELYEKYVSFMRDNSKMDFDDQMVFSYAILRKEPSILSRLQEQYRYICVDEAQDTSLIQHRIIKLLASKYQNLFMVGDEDQSIYGFRAAYPQALLDFDRTWRNSKVLFIETNYRSTPEIVNAAARFITQNKNRRPKKMVAFNPSGDKIEQIRTKDRITQFDDIARIAKEAHLSHHQVAFLYRNNDTALPIIDTLNREGIPYRAKSVDGLFFTSKIYRDICDVFALVYNPKDSDAFLRIYYKFDIFAKKELAVKAAHSGRPAFEELQSLVGKSSARKISEIRSRMVRMKNMTPDKAIGEIIDMGYGKYIADHDIDPYRLSVVRMLATREKTIPDFLARMDELQNIVKNGSRNDNANVILSTVHSSKGLEYDTVVIADVVDGVFPTPHHAQDEIEEERRLFYVAVTRAKKHLSLITFQDESSEFSEKILSDGPSKKGYIKGQKVRHKQFGNGIIQTVTNDIVTVKFGRDIRQLYIPAVEQNKLLKFL